MWARTVQTGSTSGVEVEAADELVAVGLLEGRGPRSSIRVKIGARGMAGGSLVVKKKEDCAFPLVSLQSWSELVKRPQVVKVGERGVDPEKGVSLGLCNRVAKELEKAEHQSFWPETASKEVYTLSEPRTTEEMAT